MKRQNAFIFIVLPALLLMQGCRHHDSKPSFCRLTSAGTDLFFYNDDGTLKEFVSGGTSFEIQLDDKGRMTRLTSESGSRDYYNDDTNRTIAYRFGTDSTVYYFNATGQLKREDHYYQDDADATLSHSYVYAYPDSSTRDFDVVRNLDKDGLQTGLVKYQYDTKKDPYAGPLRALYFTSPDHNVVQRSAYALETTPPTSVMVFNYVYNDQGYPVTEVLVGGFSVNFTYECP